MPPTLGRLVHYTLTAGDAIKINRRRGDFTAFCGSHPHPHQPGQPGATGHVGHVGNQAAEGDVYPALVVRAWAGADPVNLQVHLDGNDNYWVTSCTEGDGPGYWSWAFTYTRNHP